MPKNKPYSNPPRIPAGITPWDGNWDGPPMIGKLRDWNKSAKTAEQERKDRDDSASKKVKGSGMPTSSRIKEAKDKVIRRNKLQVS